jgi:hypothetical protein
LDEVYAVRKKYRSTLFSGTKDDLGRDRGVPESSKKSQVFTAAYWDDINQMKILLEQIEESTVSRVTPWSTALSPEELRH